MADHGRIEQACGCPLGTRCAHAGTTVLAGCGVTLDPGVNGPDLLALADALAAAVRAIEKSRPTMTYEDAYHFIFKLPGRALFESASAAVRAYDQARGRTA